MLIGELFDILPKSKHSASYGKAEGRYPFFKSSNVVDSFVDDADFDGEYIIIGDGGTGNSKYINGRFSVSDHNYVLKPKKTTNAKAVDYFLKKDGYQVLNAGFKGIGIKNVSKSYIESINYKFCDRFSENFIVESLDKINEGIRLAKSELESLDSIIKSRFNEMFGDIEEDPKGFGLIPLKTFVADMHIGPFGSDLKNDSFVPKAEGYAMVYEQKHAIQKSMNVPTRYISEAKFRKMQHFVVGPGDILVSCRGTLGECYLIPSNAPIGIIHPSLMMIRPKEGVNAEFLLSLLERVLKNQEGKGSGVKMAIRANDLGNIKVINPPRKRIEAFISFKDKVDKLKFVYQMLSKFC